MKKKSRGVVILCIFLILSSSIVVSSAVFTLWMRSHGLNISAGEKGELIKTEQYKNLNILSVEEFDKYWANFGSVLSPYAYLFFILMFVFAIGIWFLLNWARLGLILLLLFNVGLLVFGIIANHDFSRLWNIPISIIIVYFLTRPKIKEQFNQLEGQGGTAKF